MIAPARRKRYQKTDAAAETEPMAAAEAREQPQFVARLVPLDAGLFAFSLAAGGVSRAPAGGFTLPAIQICAPPDQEAGVEITDRFGRPGSWIGTRRDLLFVKSPSGGAVLVTAYLARGPAAAPLELEIRRLAAASGSTAAPFADAMRLRLGEAASPPTAPQGAGIEVLAHIRGRGNVRFADAPWVGRLGPGLWIEALTIIPGDPAAAEAIEYKGLTASGAETAWLGSGSPCGTIGQEIPLVGFAVRQKAAAEGVRFDCEYTGYFGSGATAGPVRNGAPCRSAVNNDPLEGMQLRITRRPAPPDLP